MKMKNKLIKVKRKVVAPKSDDSGISSEIAVTEIAMQRVEREKSINNNFKVSINLENVRRFIKQNNFCENNESAMVTNGCNKSCSMQLVDGYQCEKSRISFEDDTKSCLDYEPFEENPEGCSGSHKECESIFESNDSEPLQDSYSTLLNNNVLSVDDCSIYDEAVEVNNSKDYESRITYCNSKNSISEYSDNNIDEQYADDEKNDENNKVDNFAEEDMCAHEEKGENNFLGNYPATQDTKNFTNLFKNAEIKFSGPLNITISRPVTSNEKTFNIIPEDASPKDEIVSFKLSSKSHSSVVKTPVSYCSSYVVNEESLRQKTIWANLKLNLNWPQIKSNDDLFNSDLKSFFEMSNKSEGSSNFDFDILGEITENNYEMKKESDINCPTHSDEIRYCTNNCKSSINIQSVFVLPPELKLGFNMPVITSSNALNVSDIPKNVDDEQNNINLDQKSSPARSSSRTGSFSFQECALKRPRTSLPSIRLEDDGLSILGSSTLLEGSSVISATSDIDRVVQENDKNEFVNRWLTFTDKTDIHQILDSLCEYHFKSSCDDSKCEKAHYINENQIKRLYSAELSELYEYSKKKIFWFTSTFDIFIGCFKNSPENGRMCLVDMINDVFTVFNGTFIDKTSYISKIVAALQSTGLSFKRTIEYIILRYGTMQISLCDILLFIISKQSALDDHWCLVQKLISCRKEKLDHATVVNFFNFSLSTYPPDVILCTKVYAEIVEKDLVDLYKIPDSLRRLVGMALKTATKLEPEQITEVRDHLSQLPTRLKWDDKDRHGIKKVAFDSDSSMCTNSLLSEFNKSLMRMRCNPNTTYDSDGEDLNYFNPDHCREMDSSFNKPAKKYCTALTQRDYLIQNVAESSKDVRPQVRNADCINFSNIENSELDASSKEENYNFKRSRNVDNKMFKMPFDRTKKSRVRPFNLTDIVSLSNQESHPKVQFPRKRVFNDAVMNRINGTLNACNKASTPGPSIAHPSAQLSINSSYECNVSLHNMYPRVDQNSTEITMCELLELREALKEMNGSKFLKLSQECLNGFSIENFILNALILLKTSTNTTVICEKFFSLLHVLEDIDIHCFKNPCVKMVTEVLAMNLIYFLEKKGAWVRCKDILLRMKMKNWHSLVTSKIFFCKSHHMSHMCRYIYITEILTRAGDFHWANELFQLSSLCLLEPMSKWPYQKVPSDLTLRNNVLQLFLEEGFNINIVAVNDLLKHISVVNGGIIEGFDVWKLFDDKLSMMLDSEEEHMSSLQYLSPYISNYGWYMAKNVLQGYMLFIKDSIEHKESFKLFKLCCEKGVYHKYNGKERVIIINTSMCDFEVISILQCFFENILRRCITPHDFCIELKLSDSDQPDKPNILRNRLNRNVFALQASIIQIFKSKYSIHVNDANESTIFVKESMQKFLPFV